LLVAMAALIFVGYRKLPPTSRTTAQ
jgi:hypothetical protein